MIWAHVAALRVFVETVLRYGLPLEFICALVKVGFRMSSPAYKASADAAADHSEASQKGEGCIGFGLLVPRRERSRQGQTGAGYQGRSFAHIRDGRRGVGHR